MALPVGLTVDWSELEGLAKALEADAKMVERAASLAATRTARWARVQVARGLESRLHLPSSRLDKRVRDKPSRGRKPAVLWAGLSSVNVADAGPIKTSSGLTAAGQEFRKAFLATGRGGKVAALRRKGAGRYPLEGVGLDLVGAYKGMMDRGMWRGMNAKFVELYQQELVKLNARRRR